MGDDRVLDLERQGRHRTAMTFGLALVGLILVLLLLALVAAAVAVAGRPAQPVTRTLAAVLVALGGTLPLFLFAEDDYRNDGTRNVQAYDLNHPALPTVSLAGPAAAWWIRRDGSRAAAVAAPLIAIAPAFGTAASFVCTTN